MLGVRVPYTNLTTGVVSAPIPSPEKWGGGGRSKIIRFLSAVTGTVAAEGGSGGACLR